MNIGYLDIYPQAIEDISEIANDFIEELQDVYKEAEISGADADIISKYDCEEAVDEYLVDCVDMSTFVKNKTGCILTGYLLPIRELTESLELLDDLDISTEFYINGNDTHLNIVVNDSEYTEYFSGELRDTVYEQSAEKLVEIIKDCTTELNYETEDIYTDLKDNTIDLSDVIKSIQNKELVGSVKDRVEYIISEDKKTKIEKSKEIER